MKALFRKGNAAARGQPARTALIRQDGGWFGRAGRAPDVPMDTDVLTEADLAAYTAALERNGFFGPDSWYMNHDRNVAYAAKAINGGRLEHAGAFPSCGPRFDLRHDGLPACRTDA